MPQPVINFSFDDLKPYFFGKKRGMYYDEAVKKRDEFLPHSDGVYPAEVIERQRPNEPDIVKAFRKQIWEPITKPKFSQIVSSLSKIRRSSDWSIKYPITSDDFALVAEDETLEDYCERNFPFFDSVTNWVFSVLVKHYLIDPNAVALVMPLEFYVDTTEYLRPYPYIFNCEDVYDFVPDSYAILRNPKGSQLYRDGQSFYVINTERIQLWEQVNSKNYRISLDEPHGFNELPAFKLGGIICKSYGSDFLFESRIAGVLPNLNESVAEYTDLQAAKRLHIYPERWQYSQHECGDCKGTGQLKNPGYVAGSGSPLQVRCHSCGGLGYLGSSPYSMTIVKPVMGGTTPVPNPPAGYIEKDVEIVRIMDESWRRHIYDALAAINFQFLEQTPLNQSGTAKEVDKEELNNTVHAIAEDIVRIMDNYYRVAAYFRYRTLYPSVDKLKAMLPSIAVPDHFDLLSSQFMQEEVSKAKTAKLNSTIINAMEVEYAGKRFINEPEVKDQLELILKLDPLPNVSQDDKMAMLSNNGITQVNYIISSNIHAFVQRAINEDADFANKELADQIQVLVDYAKQQVADQKAAQQAAMLGNQNTNIDPESTEDADQEFIEEEEVINA